MTKKKKAIKKSKKKIAEQKKLIRAIKTPERYFKVDFGRYGGEVAMGAITEAQYNYWSQKEEHELSEHLSYADDGESYPEWKAVPEEARFNKSFYEYEDVCHSSGPELADGQIMTITETDKDGNYLEDDEGKYLEDQQIDMADFEKLGVEINCVAEHNSGSDSCKDKYYLFGQYFNKGGWYSNDVIKTGPEGFDFKKMKINYENADGFKVFSEIEYNGDSFYLEEDSTGKSSSFYVMEGDDV